MWSDGSGRVSWIGLSGSQLLRCVGAWALAVALVAPPPAWSQETAGSVYGRVTDTAGAAVPGVIVTARSADLIRTSRTTTTQAGRYSFNTLPPGAYVIAFDREGYVPVQRTLALSTGDSVLLHVILHKASGPAPMVTVDRDHPVFPPSWITTLESRYREFDLLPVSGTLRTAVGISVDDVNSRPERGLFLIDGLPLRHGWKFGPVSFVGPGAEALQEATIMPGRLDVGYGRSDGSAIAGVTPSGTNRWALGFRSTIGSADFNRDILALARETEDAATTAEYTAGGPLVKERLWLFASGRHLSQAVGNLSAFGDATFTTDTREDFGVARVTLAVGNGQRVEGEWLGARHRLTNAPAAGAFLAGDTGALENRRLTNNAWSGAYIGTIGGRMQLTARYTREQGIDRAEELASASTLSARTPLIDQASGIRWWSAGACTACEPRETVNNTMRATFGMAAGAHYLTVGADLARDDIQHAATPAGGAFAVRATRVSASGGVNYPVFAPDGSTWILWRPDGETGADVRNDAVFFQDRWSIGSRLQIDWGLRFDRTRVRATPSDSLLLSDQLVSPRVFVTWRPMAERPWTVDAGFARYGVDPADRLTSLAGAPVRVFAYGGAPINVTGPALAPGAALDSLFNQFQAAGGTSRASLFAFEPGLSLQVPDDGKAPRVDEWSAGVSRTIGHLGHARADIAVRNYAHLGSRTIDQSITAIDQFGRPLDVAVPVESSLLDRQYVSMSFRGRYRFGHYADVHAQYSWSRLTGNADRLPVNGDFLTSGGLAYPEYFESAWHLPSGRLADDVPHRFRLWAHSELMASDAHGMLIVTGVISRESGRPYGAVAPVAVAPFVSNPGYLQPPPALNYYFTDRDEFRTDRLTRLDLGISYRRRLPGTVHGDVIVNVHALNIMNDVEVLNPQQYVVTRTAFTDPSLQSFNPFTTTPVRDVHWSLDDSGVRQDTGRAGVPTTLGRTWLLTLGVRF